MVAARTAAMVFNRIVDRHFDAVNPRTAGRTLAAGRLSAGFAWGIFLAAAGLLFVAAWQLNWLTLTLAPLGLFITCGYSLTKRFTAWTHLFLGLSLGGAPLGAWIAVRAGISHEPLLLGAAVMFWTAGFDIIYSLQDREFDLEAGLHSLPARLGGIRALQLARFFHTLTVL